MKIGVLALQGDFIERVHILRRLKAEASPVRLPDELSQLDGLIIPGGESTTMSILMRSYSLVDSLRQLAQGGLPIWGTCAGMIMLGKVVSNHSVETLEVMNIRIRRNAYGRQVDSFETDLQIPVLGEERFRAIFIRAPIIEWVGEGVEVLARLPDDSPVAVRQGSLVACSFHPELTSDLRFHRYFLDIVASH